MSVRTIARPLSISMLDRHLIVILPARLGSHGRAATCDFSSRDDSPQAVPQKTRYKWLEPSENLSALADIIARSPTD